MTASISDKREDKKQNLYQPVPSYYTELGSKAGRKILPQKAHYSQQFPE